MLSDSRRLGRARQCNGVDDELTDWLRKDGVPDRCPRMLHLRGMLAADLLLSEDHEMPYLRVSRSLLLSWGWLICTCCLGPQIAVAQFRDASEAWGFSGGGKAAFADFDQDGWVDLYAGGKLFRNEQGKRFSLVQESGVGGGEGIWGDYDNDGRVDLFLFTGAGALYRNLGGGKFAAQPVPKLPTVNSRGAVWLDCDNDRFLDLFVGGYEVWQQTVHPDVILRNRGDGTFVQQWQSPVGACYSARGVSAADLNEDGAVDVYVSNYRLQPNHLWLSDGKGSFVEAASEKGAAGVADGGLIAYTGGTKYHIHGHTIGSALGDLNDDGHVDIFVGNFSHPPATQDRPQFLENGGPDAGFKFIDRSANAGLAWQESFASAALGDYDNDGDLDLFFTTVYAVGSGSIKNFPVLYRNEGNWKFTDVTNEQKLNGLGPTYQAAWADVDNDGDLDLCTAGKLFINELTSSHHWVQLHLRGGATVNSSACGAIARVRTGERTLTRHIESGTGEGNQNDTRLHFGLGERASPIDVEVSWPGGAKQVFTKLAPDQVHSLQEKVGE